MSWGVTFGGWLACHAAAGVMYSAENLTPMQCLMQAPPHMARWVGEHPGYKIMKWTCRRAGRYAKT